MIRCFWKKCWTVERKAHLQSLVPVFYLVFPQKVECYCGQCVTLLCYDAYCFREVTLAHQGCLKKNILLVKIWSIELVPAAGSWVRLWPLREPIKLLISAEHVSHQEVIHHQSALLDLLDQQLHFSLRLALEQKIIILRPAVVYRMERGGSNSWYKNTQCCFIPSVWLVLSGGCNWLHDNTGVVKVAPTPIIGWERIQGWRLRGGVRWFMAAEAG